MWPPCQHETDGPSWPDLAGFAVFLTVDAVWIVPIWFIAPVGVLIAALSGLCVGWASDVHRERMAASVPVRVATLFAAMSWSRMTTMPPGVSDERTLRKSGPSAASSK